MAFLFGCKAGRWNRFVNLLPKSILNKNSFLFVLLFHLKAVILELSHFELKLLFGALVGGVHILNFLLEGFQKFVKLGLLNLAFMALSFGRNVIISRGHKLFDAFRHWILFG